MRTSRGGWVSWTRPTLAATLLAAFGGCSESGPKYYPVTGRLVQESDGSVPKALIRQTIEFQSATEPNTRAFGEIQPDGSFTLSSWREGKGNNGAIAGTHKGRIILDIPQEEQTPAARKRTPPVDLKYTRFETTPWTIQVPPAEVVILKVP